MRRSSVLFHLLGAVGLVGLLSACSGGGGGGSGTTPAAAPATPIVSSGTITKFGSVYVNGKKFETNDVEVIHDGQSEQCSISPTTHCGLKEGMTVKVSGTFSGSSHTASAITQEDTLEGPIQTVDANNGTLTILGQTVVVDDTTKFDDTIPPTTLTSLAVGNVVEVSGFVKDGGIIAASFIEKKTLPPNCSAGCEVKGIVNPGSLDPGATTFQIGGLTVNFLTATISDMPAPSGPNWDNLLVKVKGTVFDSGTTTLTATKVEREGFQAPEGNEVELEGIVMSVTALGEFTLGTTEVQAANAVYLGGTIDEVAVGQKLEVEGTISGNVITASKVKFKAGVRIESNVVVVSGSTLTLDGLPGITVSVNGQTEFKKVADLAGLAKDNNVRIRGRQGAGNTVIATEVEFRNAKPDSKVTLQGVEQSAADPFITILGTTIDTSGLQLQGTDDVLISNSDTFFSAVRPNTTIVKAKGTLPGPVWKEVELESD